MANITAKDGMIINVQPLRTLDEISEFIKALEMNKANGQRNALLFKIGISTGLRVGDLVKLKVVDIKGKSSFIIKEGKTKKTRIVYLNAIMADIADYTDGMNNEDYLFQSRKGDSHITTIQAYRILATGADLIGRQDIGTHSMRKTFGYHYYKKTHDVATLMNIFNHDGQTVTLKYIGIEQEEIENSLRDFRLF